MNVTALVNGDVDLGYNANVSLSPVLDTNATIPSPIVIANGVGSFTMTAAKPGPAYTQKYVLSGSGVPPGTALAVDVYPAPSEIFGDPVNDTVTVGVPFKVLLTTAGAGPLGNNLGYNADVTVTSSADPNASIPNPITMTEGSGTFTMTASQGHIGTEVSVVSGIKTRA